MRTLILAVLASGLAGCATQPAGAPLNYAALAGLAQTDYAEVKGVAALYCASPAANAGDCANVAKIEAVADPLLAALTASSTATQIQQALQAVAAVVTAPLPTGAIKPQTQADINTALAVLNAALQLAPAILPLL